MIPPNCYPGGTKLTVGSHEIEIIKYISQGGFALVYTCYISPSYKGSNIACLKRVVVPSKWQLSLLRQEVDAMRRLRGNKHIVSYIDSHAARLNEESATQQYEVFLLMEYCENKGLIDFMNTRLAHKLTEPEILQIMYQTTIGVAMCHHLQPPLIHRDIKIENVLIDKYNTYKLADFGSSVGYIPPPKNPHDLHKLRDDIMQHTTPQYRAPEMIDLSKGFAVDDKSDVWALGVFLYKLCYYTTPFESPNQSLQDMEHAILHSSQTLKFKDQPGSMFSPRLKNIIKCCLREDPRRRPNATQLLQEIVSMMGLPLPNVIPHSVEHQIKEKQTKPTANASQPLIRKDVVKPDPFTLEKTDPFESIDKTKFLDKSTKRLSAVNPIARPVTGSELSTSLTYKYTNKSATSLKDFVQKQVELSEESMARNSRKSEDKSDTLDFLKSKQESNHTGGSIKLSLQKHLRKISTGGSSVHSVSANNTGNTLVYNKKRSSISSIKQLLTGGRKTSDNHNEYEYFKGDSKHSSDTKHSNDKRYSLRNEEKPERESRNSIASRMQTLLRESESTPNLRTAHGYGKFTDLDDLNSINQLNFSSDESINLPKAPHVKQLLPPKIPASLSSKKSLKNSTVINSIYSKSSKLHPISGKLTKVPIQQEILSKKPINSHESKKPPPKPKKPTYLKSSAKNLYQRRSSNSSEISIPDLDDLEKKFNERFPSYA